jgi:hypothetical protein
MSKILAKLQVRSRVEVAMVVTRHSHHLAISLRVYYLFIEFRTFRN